MKTRLIAVLIVLVLLGGLVWWLFAKKERVGKKFSIPENAQWLRSELTDRARNAQTRPFIRVYENILKRDPDNLWIKKKLVGLYRENDQEEEARRLESELAGKKEGPPESSGGPSSGLPTSP